VAADLWVCEHARDRRAGVVVVAARHRLLARARIVALPVAHRQRDHRVRCFCVVCAAELLPRDRYNVQVPSAVSAVLPSGVAVPTGNQTLPISMQLTNGQTVTIPLFPSVRYTRAQFVTTSHDKP
jgi:hypothetical protein